MSPRSLSLSSLSLRKAALRTSRAGAVAPPLRQNLNLLFSICFNIQQRNLSPPRPPQSTHLLSLDVEAFVSQAPEVRVDEVLALVLVVHGDARVARVLGDWARAASSRVHTPQNHHAGCRQIAKEKQITHLLATLCLTQRRGGLGGEGSAMAHSQPWRTAGTRTAMTM
jgi:hypothetical protein